MADLTYSDQLAVWGIVLSVISIILGLAIFAIQVWLSRKVDNAILEQKERNDKTKHYHMVRIKANTERIKENLVRTMQSLEEHMKAPSEGGWITLEALVETYSLRVQADWYVTEYDLSRVRELVKEPYMVDKYADVCVSLTIWTYSVIVEKIWNYLPSIQDAIDILDPQIKNLDKFLALIDKEES